MFMYQTQTKTKTAVAVALMALGIVGMAAGLILMKKSTATPANCIDSEGICVEQ